MFQTKLTDPDVRAASAITPGVVDRSGAMRAEAEAQKWKDIQAFGTSVIEAGFAIDKHMQTNKIAEKQAEFSEDFASYGLDALSDEDKNYIQEYTGNLSAIQKDQIKPHIYKAIINKNLKEAVNSRPWLESELRQASSSSTGMASAAIDLSLQSQAVREKEMVAAQQQKDAQVDTFKKSFSEVFGAAYVELAFSQVDPNLDPQDQVNAFLSADPSRATRLNNATNLKAMRDQAELLEQTTSMTEQQRSLNQANLMQSIAKQDLLNMQSEGENALVSNLERFSTEGQQVLSQIVSSGESVYNLIPTMTKEDQQTAIGILKTGIGDLRSQVTDSFMKVGATTLPSIVQSKLEEGDRLINSLEGALAGDTVAMQNLKNEVEINRLKQQREIQQFTMNLRESDRAAYNLYLADAAVGAGGAVAAQQIQVATQKLTQRQLSGADEATVPAAMGSEALGFLTPDTINNLPPEQQAQALQSRSSMYFEPFLTVDGFKYEDVVKLSTNLSVLEPELQKKLLDATDPTTKQLVSQNLSRAATTRINALRDRIDQAGYLEITEMNGVPIVAIKDGARTAGPTVMQPMSMSSVSMQRERNKVAQEMNALMRYILPTALIMQGSEPTDDVINNYIRDAFGALQEGRE